MKFIASFIVTLVLITGCTGINTTPVNVSNLELLDYGLLNISVKNQIDMATTATGKHNVTVGVEFYETTNEIEAIKNKTFGIKYKITGTPVGEIANFTFKVTHPPINGKTESKVKIKGKIGSWRADFYTFDEDYELVAGEWKMQILEQSSTLLEQIFNVKI